ncbi:thioesterase superfamily protein [Moniliophthora roreri MCA 2997]|uniref:Thioesterase superfamily protein n=2 Tax=Moniliophthora roreri TaxID=221103 RepID=V2XCC4_MONRO|nr:thioesterase superfamily protein [Moniliophthora roreri MCA 2997]
MTILFVLCGHVHGPLCNVQRLQQAFRDPSSPFHLPPGTQGPASPDSIEDNSSSWVLPTQDAEQYEQARRKMIEAGFCPQFLWEQKIVWGDHDSFQHVNNVHYVRFIESSRTHWMSHLGHRLGGPAKAQALLKGQGVSLILKSIEVKFRRPVTYPDTLLISHKPYIPQLDPQRRVDPSELHLTSSVFSVIHQAFVAHGTEVIVWYDYDNLKKCDPGEELKGIVWEPFGGIPS